MSSWISFTASDCDLVEDSEDVDIATSLADEIQEISKEYPSDSK